MFFLNYLKHNKMSNKPDNLSLIKYFDKYKAFCLDLSLDSVLKGELNFNYNDSETNMATPFQTSEGFVGGKQNN